MPFDLHQIVNLVGQLGGDHQQAAQQFAGMGQIDPGQHSGLLQQYGIDPQQLANGGYDQQFQAQNDPNFNGYQPGMDLSQQQPDFSGYGPQGYQGDSYQQAGGYGDQVQDPGQPQSNW
jgi:hypothetical protein